MEKETIAKIEQLIEELSVPMQWGESVSNILIDWSKQRSKSKELFEEILKET